MNTKLMTSVMALALGCGTLAQSTGLTPGGQTTAQNTPAIGARTGSTGASASSAYGSGFGGYGGSGGVVSGRSNPNFATRLNSVVARSASSPATVVAFEPMKPKELEEMQEDLKVFSVIMYRGLERAFGDRSTEYKLGVPMLLQGDHRVVQANYLDGFGVVAKMTVPFPVAAVEGEAKTKRDPGAPMTEWEKARRALLGLEGDLNPDGAVDSAAPFDDKLVTALKKQMFESIKNGSNLRHVKPDEWISVVIVGGAAAAEGGKQGTMLTMRLKKSALDGSIEDIEKAAQTNAYFDTIENTAHTINRYQSR